MLCKFMNLRQKEYSEEQKQNAPPENKDYKNGFFWEMKTYLKMISFSSLVPMLLGVSELSIEV